MRMFLLDLLYQFSILFEIAVAFLFIFCLKLKSGIFKRIFPTDFKGEKENPVDFTIEMVEPKTCLVGKSDIGCLWHRRLTHVGMRNLTKLEKGGHIYSRTNKGCL